MSQTTLFDELQQETPSKPSGPVTCLGQTFASDHERRKHFTEKLREKLQDSEFRKIEGFPHGSDDDILALSDPPYYTACPNPWLADFIAEWEAEKIKLNPDCALSGVEGYHREPFPPMSAKARTTLSTTRTPTTPKCRTRPSCVTFSITPILEILCLTASAEPG